MSMGYVGSPPARLTDGVYGVMSRGYVGSPPADITAGVFSIDEHGELVSPNLCIGVQDTGGRGTNGAVLRQVMLTGDVTYGHLREVSMPTSYFDAHPSYQFPDWTDASGNVFCTIPRAYWWRGNMPDVADGTTPRWTMLLSPVPRDGFAANAGAFKRSGVWLDQYYYGKYRGYNAGSSKVGSKAGQTPWGGVSFNNFGTYCANNGTGYHMQSLFEWHEILGRMVIEKATFQLMPWAIRATQASCVYRGVSDFAYGPTTGVSAEWMDGVRTNASGNYEVWVEAGGTYNVTAIAPPIYADASTYYGQSLLSGGMFDSLFITAALGPNTTCMIPDMSGGRLTTNHTSCVCSSTSNASQRFNGAFLSRFDYLPSFINAAIGSRLAKW